MSAGVVFPVWCTNGDEEVALAVSAAEAVALGAATLPSVLAGAEQVQPELQNSARRAANRFMMMVSASHSPVEKKRAHPP